MEIIPKRNKRCCGSCDSDMCPSLWSKLSDDLTLEFLHRIPHEAMLRFRCVSKCYNFTISRLCGASAPVTGFVFQYEHSIHFETFELNHKQLRRFFKQNPNPQPSPYRYGFTSSAGNFDPTGGKLVRSYLSLLPFKPQVNDFLGCSNGFFLVRNTSSLPIQYHVCNPATTQHVQIPINPAHLQEDSFAGLAFDPLAPLPHHFKIVRIDCRRHAMPTSSSLNHQPWELDVFSSSTKKWVNHPISLEPEILEFQWNMRSAYFNGVFYMLSMRRYLVCFDLNTTDNHALKARAVKLPPTSGDSSVGLIETSNRYLYYACKVEADLLVWTFQVTNEASPWVLKYNISISTTRTRPECLIDYIRNIKDIFAVDLRTQIIYLGREYAAYSYNTKNNQVKSFGQYGPMLYAKSLSFYPYSCCLVRLSE